MKRDSETPLYQQLADAIRRQIRSGDLAVGDQIPSEAELIDQYGVGRNTVRQAVGLLRTENLVRTTHGRGTYVVDPREAPLPYRASVAHSRSRREEHPDLDAFQTELRELGREGEEEITVETLPAPEDIADRLGIEAGHPVVLRRRRQTVDRRPSALADSWFPAELVEGTEIAEGEDVSRGTDQVMAELGLEAVRRRDEVTARMPTPTEAQALQIAGGVPVVFVVATEITESGQAVEVYVRTMPADRHVLVYEVDKTV